ncbi:MAG: c-type cytochrome, partial [Myxococcota bacterium]
MRRQMIGWAGLLMVACGGDASDGQAIYENRLDDGNVFACGTCHALREPADDGILRPGHAIGDAVARPSWKNGEVGSLLDAVNSCRDEWMNAPEPWTADDPDWLALESFLAAQAPATAEPIRVEIVEPPADLSGGDPMAGMAAYEERCVACHSADGSITDLAPNVLFRGLEPEYIARRVRTSGRPGGVYGDVLTGGVMPFWGADRLSETELLDIVAYVAMDASSRPTPPPTTPDDTPADEPPEGCTADHFRVGRVAELQEFFHDVAGTAEIIDDCTVEIRDFVFDGEGIDVRIYGGFRGDYDLGISMSENLLLPGGY